MDPRWEVEDDGVWYLVTARASCPHCGAELSHQDKRRLAAGPPETPPLTLRVTGPTTVELSAAGFILPIVEHRCGASSQKR